MAGLFDHIGPTALENLADKNFRIDLSRISTWTLDNSAAKIVSGLTCHEKVHGHFGTKNSVERALPSEMIPLQPDVRRSSLMSHLCSARPQGLSGGHTLLREEGLSAGHSLPLPVLY